MDISSRKNRNNRIIDVLNPDKGKRHYWDDVYGDYGFMESSDRK